MAHFSFWFLRMSSLMFSYWTQRDWLRKCIMITWTASSSTVLQQTESGVVVVIIIKKRESVGERLDLACDLLSRPSGIEDRMRRDILPIIHLTRQVFFFDITSGRLFLSFLFLIRPTNTETVSDSIGETFKMSETGGAHAVFPQCSHTIVIWTELTTTTAKTEQKTKKQKEQKERKEEEKQKLIYVGTKRNKQTNKQTTTNKYKVERKRREKKRGRRTTTTTKTTNAAPPVNKTRRKTAQKYDRHRWTGGRLFYLILKL